MSQSVQTPIDERNHAENLADKTVAGHDAQRQERRIDVFVAELRQMTCEERIRASRYSFNRWERWVYAARFPEEAPLLNGELEWIAATLE